MVEVYKSNKSKGWGAIAKEMGIKPGSAEFHAMKKSMKSKGGSKSNSNGKSNSNDDNKGKGKGKKK